MKDNLIAQVVYRSIFVGVSFVGILLSIVNGIQFDGNIAIGYDLNNFKFYTYLTNYICFAVMITVLVSTTKKLLRGETRGHNTVIQKFKFYAVIYILVTMVVYAVMLSNPFSLDYWIDIRSLTLHFICPSLFIIDWFVFDEHRTVSILDPLFVIILPLVYVAIILILEANVPGFVSPYFFLQAGKIGYQKVFLYVLGLCFVFLLIGYLFFVYDKLVKIDGKYKLTFKKLGWLKNKPLD